MRVAVVGAGAIGGFVAAALARAGTEVGVVARGAHLEAIRRDGLSVESDLGSFTVRVAAASDVREFGALDVALLTFKAHHWPDVLPQLASLSGTGTTLVTLQNGLPFWYVRTPPVESVDPGGRIGALFPDAQIVGGVVHVSGHIARPGTIRQSGGMRYVFGDAGVSAHPSRAALVADVFRAAELAPEVDPGIRATIWLKLVNNVGLNPVSALRGMTIKPMLADPQAREDVRVLMEQALHVGQAMGVVKDVDIDARIAYAARLNDVKTSMLQDFELGKPLESEPILGAVVELGKRYGVDVSRIEDARDRLHAAHAAAARR